MRLLLLLLSCVCLSNAYSLPKEVEYGMSYSITLRSRSQSIEFTPEGRSTVSVLWRRSAPPASEDSRMKVSGNVFTIDRMSMRDSGLYRVKDTSQRTEVTEKVKVTTPIRFYTMLTEETLVFHSDLSASSCNIIFFPNEYREVEIILSGTKQFSYYHGGCEGFTYTIPCEMKIENLQKACAGRYEIIDDNDDRALVVNLEVQSPAFNPTYLAIGGFIVVVICVGCCCTRFCCGDSKSKKKKSKSAADPEPAVHHHEYDREPAAPRRNQLSEPSTTRYSAQPSRATTGPLIHNPPVNVPPAHTEFFPYTQQPNTSYTPLCSDPDPRFELKGMNFNLASPLTSDSAQSDVYTSDKLNFL